MSQLPSSTEEQPAALRDPVEAEKSPSMEEGAPYEVPITEALRLLRLQQEQAGDAIRYLVKKLEQGFAGQTYHQSIGRFSVGTRLRIWFANADDEATLVGMGHVKTINWGDTYNPSPQVLDSPGNKYFLTVYTVNGGGGPWRVDLHGDFNGNRNINLEAKGNDMGWVGRERIYIFDFEVG